MPSRSQKQGMKKSLEKHKLTMSSSQSSNSQPRRQKHVEQTVNEEESSDDEICPCAECDQEIFQNDMAMQCDLCDHWFCNGCLKFTKQTYERIEKSKTTCGFVHIVGLVYLLQKS